MTSPARGPRATPTPALQVRGELLPGFDDTVTHEHLLVVRTEGADA